MRDTDEDRDGDERQAIGDIEVSERAKEQAAVTGADPERLQYAMDIFDPDTDTGLHPAGDARESINEEEWLKGAMEAAEFRFENDIKQHLDDIEDGAGCTEIWEHLSEQRQEEDQ